MNEEALQKERLGDGLYWACRTKVEEAFDERVKATGTPPSVILQSMLLVALGGGNADVVAFCLKRGAIVGGAEMETLAVSKSFACHEEMIRAKAVDITYCTEHFGNMLSIAVASNQLDWARFCLKQGANPNWSRVDMFKLVIAAAAEKGFRKMVKLLLRFGATLDGSSAIVLAAGAGKSRMVRLLLEKGANVNEMGAGRPFDRLEESVGTPLHRAARNGHVKTVRLLIRAGADLTRLDRRERTPEMLARQHDQSEVLNILDESRRKGSNQPEWLHSIGPPRKKQKRGLHVAAN